MMMGKVRVPRSLGLGLLLSLAMGTGWSAHLKMASSYGFANCTTEGDVTACSGMNIFNQDPAFLFSFAGAPPASFTINFGDDPADSFGLVTGDGCSLFNITCPPDNTAADVNGTLGTGLQEFTFSGLQPTDLGLANVIFEYTSAPTDAPTLTSGTPEPSSLVLLAVGMGLGMVGLRRRRNRLS